MTKTETSIIEEVRFVQDDGKKVVKSDATLEFKGGRIWFVKSAFGLKDEIKAMKGSRWHGFEVPPVKMWSVDDCSRNRFQLEFLKGKNPYAWFDRQLVRHVYTRPVMPHQCDLADSGLTYHYQIWAAEMGVGKTLAAIEVMERAPAVAEWWYVAPKAVLKAIERELKKWKYVGPPVKLMTYEALVTKMKTWSKKDEPPQGIIFDEASKLKGAVSQRSQAAQMIADQIRFKYDWNGYVILMSGTPSPKSPIDWWSLCEIAYPGFLREGSPNALTQRLSWMEKAPVDHGHFMKRVAWRDNPERCQTCGEFEDLHEGNHKWSPSKNEVAFMFERLKGLVVVKLKKDCLNLPDKRFRKIICEPTQAILRVSQAIMNTSESTIVAVTRLRELSDGFQYIEVAQGTSPCTMCKQVGEVKEWFKPDDEECTYHQIEAFDADFVAKLQSRMATCPKCHGKKEMPRMVRQAKEIPCPKFDVLTDLLTENEEVGRILVFAGFEGSIDRTVRVCISEGWDVVRCDGRGFSVFTKEGQLKSVDPLEYWAERGHEKVAFVAHPESGGMGLTLVEARTAVFLSNSFKPEYRAQAMDRIHRPGMDLNLGCEIVDIVHLQSDERVLQVLSDNRNLELLTLGEFNNDVAV